MSFKIFNYSIINADGKTLVEFTLTDKDGKNGYPGNLETKSLMNSSMVRINSPSDIMQLLIRTL